jgi:TolA-binding protein
MPDTTVALDDLTQQIAQHESDLNRLRQEFEVRQTRLTDLARQREELQDQLRQIEADIQAVTKGQIPRPAATPVAKPTTVTSSDAKPATAISPKLADALVEVAREVNRPLTAKELGAQLILRKFPTTSGNITNLVQSRLTDLVQRGVFRRAEGQPGVVLAKSGNEKKSPTPKAHSNGKAEPAKKIAQPGPRKGQPSLRSLLTDLLQKARKPVPARDLAEQVLATGYQTKSTKFTDVVWTALGQMKAENVKGQGWRLKKG